MGKAIKKTELEALFTATRRGDFVRVLVAKGIDMSKAKELSGGSFDAAWKAYSGGKTKKEDE